MAIDKRVALVTGASRGIGRAIALRLARDGRHVVLMSRSEAPLNDLKGSIEANGGAASVSPCDVGDPKALAGAVEGVGEKLGRLDILVNNAGITKDGLALRMSDEDWDAVLEVNLTAVFRLTRELTQAMMKRRYGRIVNITSVVGVTGNPGQANYCASKAGMIGFSKSLAQEIASRNVTVNCVAPGFIESAMTGKLNDKQKEGILGSIPMRRMGTGAEIASAVLYLASQEASYVTGQTLHVNGGMAMI